MEGASAPTLLFRFAATWAKNVGAEAPPTKAGAAAKNDAKSRRKKEARHEAGLLRCRYARRERRAPAA
ncbi:DUF6053 domain-containing protein [Lysobacter enzymogenes]|uniref:DUF6053 domain-containing protein n=1 Tax=Lysobacter enzymogenes TaxID=69 RepID=UPI003D18E509